jgi:hypothetical protein
MRLNNVIDSFPIAYSVNGKQYVAVAVGSGSSLSKALEMYPGNQCRRGCVAARREDSYTGLAMRRQSERHVRSLSGGFGPARWRTDLVSVISALVTPLGSRRPVAVPLTMRAWPPGSLGGQNSDTFGSLAMFRAADLPMAHALTFPSRSTDSKLVRGPSLAIVSR